MPTQRKRRRVREEVEALAGFPPEGIREPFKPIDLNWTQRFPLGTGGQRNDISPDQLGPDEAVEIVQMRPDRGGLVEEWGLSEIGDPRNTPVAILHLNQYKDSVGNEYLVSIDSSGLRYLDSGSWNEISADGNGTNPVNSTISQVRSAMVLDDLVWVNVSGSTYDTHVEPQKWSDGDANSTRLTADANAPEGASFVVSYADRVVFADITTASSVRDRTRVEWSASGDATDFTSTGAGGVSLQDTAPGAYSDDITGLAVIGEFLVVLRKESIWLGQRTGNVDAPITFTPAVQGIGCAVPDSVQELGSLGVVFMGADANIYLFHPAQRSVVPIGTPIHERVVRVADSITDVYRPQHVDSGYVISPDRHEYWFTINSITNENYTDFAFVWSVDRYINEERLVWRERPFTAVTATSVPGTANKNVSAMYASPVFGSNTRRVVIGTEDGEVFFLADGPSDDGVSRSPQVTTPQFTAGHHLVDVRRFNLAYFNPGSDDGFTLYISTDGGETWTNEGNTTLPATDGAVTEVSVWLSPGVGYNNNIMFRLVGFTAGAVVIGYRIGFLQRGRINDNTFHG